MFKLVTASVFIFVLAALNNNAFATTLDCKFKDITVTGVKTIELKEESLVINKDMEIPLEKSRVKCGSFGRQTRFDGNALGFQIVLKSCTSDAQLEGHLIDEVNEMAAEVLCDKKK